MPERSLRRLESYQSGRTVNIGDVVIGEDADADGDVGGTDGRSRNDNDRAPPFLSQFSLIGDADDDDDDGRSMNNGSNATGVRFLRHRLAAISSLKVATAFSLCFIIILFALIGFLSGGNNKGVGTKDGPGASTSPQSSDQCPIQSSYSVSSEIMKLKKTSTVENVQNGAVATDHPVCSKIGVSILQDGGNAADAAIASALCLGVANPTSSGIGGGAFILVHSNAKEVNDDDDDEVTTLLFEDARTHQGGTKERDVATAADDDEVVQGNNPNNAHRRRQRKVTEFIDCRENAPQNSTYDMYETDPESSMLGGLAIAIPGELRGLELLHRRHGSMPWEKLVRPAMELARDGFRVETYLGEAIQYVKKHIHAIPNLAHLLTKDSDGVTLLEEGDVMVRSQYSKTLEAIMHGGADALYQGDMAKMLAKDIQDAGGIITSADISNYRPVLRDPLIAKVSGYNVVGSPPPSSGGGAIIGALRFLSGFVSPYSALADTLSKHWYVEACRHVFAIRMSLSDPDFAPEENSNAVKDLIEGEYMESLRKLTLDDEVLNLSQYGGSSWAQLKDVDGKGNLVDAQEGDRRRRMEGDRRRRMESTRDSQHTIATRNLRLFNYLEDHGTSSLSVVDNNRNTVVITSSVNLAFGSKVVSPSTGIVLNNQMDDFSSPGRANFFGLRPSESNYIAPGKRPLSSMSPTMVFRDSTRHDQEENDTADLGKLVLSLGASGGPKIITSLLQTILNYAFVGMPLYESISTPRIHNQLLYHGAAATNIEEATLPQGPSVHLPDRERMALEKRGHKIIPTDFLGTVQAVGIDFETDLLTAVSDIRKQGMSAGY